MKRFKLLVVLTGVYQGIEIETEVLSYDTAEDATRAYRALLDAVADKVSNVSEVIKLY